MTLMTSAVYLKICTDIKFNEVSDVISIIIIKIFLHSRFFFFPFFF